MKNHVGNEPDNSSSESTPDDSDRIALAVRRAHERRLVVIEQAELEQVCGGIALQSRTSGLA